MKPVLRIFLAACACVMALPGAAGAAPSLFVDASAGRHAISPDIYGMNFADPVLAQQIGLPVDRWGGNSTERYNFHQGVTNTGNDWYFENIADCWGDDQAYCSNDDFTTYRSYQSFIEKDRSVGASTLMALPLAGYVSRDPDYGHPLKCGFPKTTFATQNAFDPYDANCGNGVNGGTNLSAPDPLTTTSRTWGASDNGDWVEDIKTRYGGVRFYELGNEPALWDSTHRDIHPAGTTYDELWTKTRDSAIAVKDADPAAQTLAFSEWGWPAYSCSGKDIAALGYCSPSAPDRAAHGGTALAPWLLQQAKAYADANGGRRIVDYFDLHYYAQGGSTTDVTRSLWDPTYTDPSWIGAEINLIPRMKAWVADNYPGTKISLSEYDLGVGDPTTRSLIQADTLGIFAREGLDMATRWGAPSAGDEMANAWRIYRNYDGAGGRFGDTFVQSTSTDQSQVAVYGATRGSDGALTIVVVNKSLSPQASPISLNGFSASGPAQLYNWAGSGIASLGSAAVSGGQISTTFPASSVTMLVVPSAAAPGGGGGPDADKISIRSAKLSRGSVRRSAACRKSLTLTVTLSGSARISARIQKVKGKKAKTLVKKSSKGAAASHKLKLKACAKRKALKPGKYRVSVALADNSASRALKLRVRR